MTNMFVILFAATFVILTYAIWRWIHAYYLRQLKTNLNKHHDSIATYNASYNNQFFPGTFVLLKNHIIFYKGKKQTFNIPIDQIEKVVYSKFGVAVKQKNGVTHILHYLHSTVDKVDPITFQSYNLQAQVNDPEILLSFEKVLKQLSIPVEKGEIGSIGLRSKVAVISIVFTMLLVAFAVTMTVIKN